MMTGWDIGVTIAAMSLAITALVYAFKIGQNWKGIQSDMSYMRRDLDQILRMYHLTPISERERRGRH